MTCHNPYHPRSRFGALVALALTSCATAHVRVETVPEGAKVLQMVRGGEPIPLGQTPLSLDMPRAEGNAGQGPIVLRVVADDFERENILLPRDLPGGTHVLSIALKEKDKPAKAAVDGGTPPPAAAACPSITLPPVSACPSYPETAFAQIATAVAQAQNDIFRKDYARAADGLTALTAQYGDVATLHVLLGNVHYLRRDVARALKSYERALKLNPQDAQTARLVRRLKSLSGEGGTP